MYLYCPLLAILLIIRSVNLLFVDCASTGPEAQQYSLHLSLLSTQNSMSSSDVTLHPKHIVPPRDTRPCKNHPSLFNSFWMFSSPVMFGQIITHHLIHDVSLFAWLHLYIWPWQFVFILDEIFSRHLGFKLSLLHNSADK